MKREAWLPIVFGGALAALLLGVIFFGSKLTGSPPSIPLQAPDQPQVVVDISNLMAASDQVVTMLTAITIALYVLLGFSFQQTLADSSRSRFRIDDVLVGIGFIASTFLSFYFAYVARSMTFEFSAFSYADEVALRTAILWNRELFGSQALLVSVAAIFAFYLVLRTFVMRESPQERTGVAIEKPQAAPKPAPQATKPSPLKVVDAVPPAPKSATTKPTERRVV